jgi:hypothetical protein
VLEKMIGTLTSNKSNSMHTLMSSIFVFMLCSTANDKHFTPNLLKNYTHIIAFTPDLQRISFYSITKFFHHGFTTKLILSLILYNKVLFEL